MTFDDLVTASSVFIDANTFTYHFEPHPVLGQPCQGLMTRIELGDVYASTTTHVLSELAHRLMTLEATKAFGWPFAGIAQRLRRHSADVQKLTGFQQAVDSVLNSKIQVLTIQPKLIVKAAAVSRQTGLLSNDALIVAVMQENGLTNLASNDADFDRVTGIVRFAPA